ncbi:tripartite tricarboxylate transporter TctB family protein [Hominifimenecus sp. rT4P-3]|uniref:tripartite tricarboxylate transporter TctB family protein n=1 Tax=Hominifimenecus sp. rT4P-3 TaxID=3242979 RepID=UPI003DA26C4B
MNKKTDRTRSYMMILFMLIISVAALIGSLQIFMKRPGLADAGMYPLLMSGLMVLTMIGALLEAYRWAKKAKKDSKAEEETEKGNTILAALKAEFPARTVFLGACMLGYGILFHFVGFYISTALFMLVSMLGLYRGKKVKMTIFVTALTLVCVYVIIEKIFNIPLP